MNRLEKPYPPLEIHTAELIHTEYTFSGGTSDSVQLLAGLLPAMRLTHKRVLVEQLLENSAEMVPKQRKTGAPLPKGFPHNKRVRIGETCA